MSTGVKVINKGTRAPDHCKITDNWERWTSCSNNNKMYD